MQQRAISFSSGSRQAPDPYDQFLEHEGFYRKHTARDASSLFRVISEQIYDTQMHHLAIRKKCVNYMRKHRKFFANLIDHDIEEYLDEMCKPKTFATMIELQAVGLLYERNIILFEPFNLGNMFGKVRAYSQIFRVFCTPEKHFDSVYTSAFIKDAAICQSLVYELLYKDLFKLPDVQYAVEIMLHNGNVESEQLVETNENGYQTRVELNSNISFPLDTPQSTNCILEDSKLCRFHDSVCGDDCAGKTYIDFLLTNKYTSCVRQLLMEGITPFPYKVAKALDPTMYRNIEFDSWNEARKELRLQNWYCGDGNFKVGAKCHVKLGKNDELYTGHIQDISSDRTHCIVFIEQFGEKRLVSYDALSPLSNEEFKPWTLPYRFHRQLQKYNSMRMPRPFHNYRFKAQETTVQNYCKTFRSGITKARHEQYAGATISMDYSKDKQQQHFHKSYIYNLTHLENFHARTLEYVTMPLTVEHNIDSNDSSEVENGNHVSTTSPANDVVDFSGETTAFVEDYREAALVLRNNGPDQAPEYIPEYASPFYSMTPSFGGSDDLYGYGCDPAIQQQMGHQNGLYYVFNPAPVGAAPGSGHGYYGPAMQPAQPVYISTTPMAGPAPVPQYICATGNPFYVNPMPNSAVMPTLLTQATSLSHSIQEHSNSSSVGIATPLSGRINYDAKKSFKTNGMDLPSDIPTLRYFYNLGIDSHNRRRYSHESSISGRDANAVKDEGSFDAKDNNANTNKADDNNNIPHTANYSKTSSSSTNPSYGQSNKSQYGPSRRFQPRSMNHPIVYRQTQRKNTSNNDAAYVGSYSNSRSECNSKHQSQHDNTGDRHADSNRPNSANPLNNGNSNHRMQYSRNNGRKSSSENMGHAGLTSLGSELPRDINVGNDHGNFGQVMHLPPPYGPPPSSSLLSQSQQYYEHPHDFCSSNNGNFVHSYPNGTASGASTLSGGSVLVPVQFHQPNSAPVSNSLLQPTTLANTVGNSLSYNASAPFQSSYFGYPPTSTLMHPVNFGGGVLAPAGFYSPSNQLSSNASESSGNGVNDYSDCNLLQQPPPPSVGPYGGSISIYVSPSNATNSNVQSTMHRSAVPLPHVNSGTQAFWCEPPPSASSGGHPPTPTHIASALTNMTLVGAAQGNRISHQQKQNENEAQK